MNKETAESIDKDTFKIKLSLNVPKKYMTGDIDVFVHDVMEGSIKTCSELLGIEPTEPRKDDLFIIGHAEYWQDAEVSNE